MNTQCVLHSFDGLGAFCSRIGKFHGVMLLNISFSKVRWKNIIYFIYNFAALTFVVTGKQVLHVGGLLELSNHWYENYVNFFVTILEHAFGEIDNRDGHIGGLFTETHHKGYSGNGWLLFQKQPSGNMIPIQRRINVDGNIIILHLRWCDVA